MSWRWYIFGGNRPGHLTGAFFFTLMFGTQYLPIYAVLITLVGSIGLECFQWAFEPVYDVKLRDTFMDLLADFAGIYIGYLGIVHNWWA